MAGKGGGAWKVAYADFVTAMMAFFMVMWLCSQNQKVRQAVARYFNNPVGFETFGTSTKPAMSGAAFNMDDSGEVPGQDGIQMGKGRDKHTGGEDVGPATKMVHDFVMRDKKAYEYWSNQAGQLRDSIEAKGMKPDPKKKGRERNPDWAVNKLARQLRGEFTQEMPKEAKGLYQDMLYRVIREVNWNEIAEDLLNDH